MKRMKKLIALLAVAMLLLAMAGCSGSNSEASSDKEYVTGKGKLVVGITDFEPMDYEGENGEWIGYDADLAKAFAEKLGVDVEFSVITWDYKVTELDNKTIDCVWNGMTLTDDVKAQMATTKAYCKNAQVVVMKADKIDQYKSVEDMKDLRVAVEQGSAGEDVATENGLTTVPVTRQADALMEVAGGTSDAAIIDLLMAGAMIGEGTSYADLTYSLRLSEEEYGIGFRKGSDLAAELNSFLAEVYKDGTMAKLADTYKISQDTILPQ